MSWCCQVASIDSVNPTTPTSFPTTTLIICAFTPYLLSRLTSTVVCSAYNFAWCECGSRHRRHRRHITSPPHFFLTQLKVGGDERTRVDNEKGKGENNGSWHMSEARRASKDVSEKEAILPIVLHTCKFLRMLPDHSPLTATRKKQSSERARSLHMRLTIRSMKPLYRFMVAPMAGLSIASVAK